MKACMKCGEVQPPDNFYRHPGMADGMLGKCKECTKKDVNENRKRKIEYYRELDRKRGKLPHRVAAREEYAKTENYRKSKIFADQRYVASNTKKRSAQIMTGNAIRDGRLQKQQCEWCGSNESQAHHFDYGKPLDVTWLCVKCHNTVHRIDREHKRSIAVVAG